MTIREYLKDNLLITDGAMGTYFEKKYPDHSDMVEEMNLVDGKVIEQIHLEYIQSGARLIRTNTFAANTMFFSDIDKVKNIITKGYQIAKDAVKASGREVYIAADIGPIHDSGLLGYDTVIAEYKEICDTFLACGAEIFVFETLPEFTYMEEITRYLKSKQDVFIITQFSIDKSGYTKGGLSAKRIMEKAALLDSIDAYGFNCGLEAAHLYQILKELTFANDKFVCALPNAGYPLELRGRTVYSGNVSYYVERMEQIANLGINVLGGCCGTTPKYIQGIATSLQEVKPKEKKIGVDDLSTDLNHTSAFFHKLQNHQKPIVVELDPPFQTDISKIMQGASILKACDVDLLTLADSPMARTRMDAGKLASKVQREVGITTMAHMCCRDKNVIAMRSGILGDYINDIRHYLIVTGDPVGRESRGQITPVFDFNSIRLMQYVSEMNAEVFAESPVLFGGALNYYGANPDAIVKKMKMKVEAGCKFFLTQPIYSQEDVERIQYLKERVDAYIVCGLMPLVSYKNATFVANEMQGIRIPEEIINRYTPEMSKEEAEEQAIAITLEIIDMMKDVADGYYFITPFNRASLIAKIIEQIKK